MIINIIIVRYLRRFLCTLHRIIDYHVKILTSLHLNNSTANAQIIIIYTRGYYFELRTTEIRTQPNEMKFLMSILI